MELVKEKGVYTYEYMDSFEKFSEDKLPERSKFFSFVQNKHISKIYIYIHTNIHTYIHIYIYIHIYLDAVDVWNVFKRNTMGDYHDLYLKAGVFLLADVFETFINTCLEYYVLDSCHYFSSPGLS